MSLPRTEMSTSINRDVLKTYATQYAAETVSESCVANYADKLIKVLEQSSFDTERYVSDWKAIRGDTEEIREGDSIVEFISRFWPKIKEESNV